MTLRHFKIFVAVCDTMSMTAAAEELYISQSAVSQTIADLEQFYHIRLFERLSRRLYLTQAGGKLLGYARHMVSMNADIEKDMKTLRDTGLVRVGASVTVGSTVLPRLVSEFRKANPSIHIEVFEANTEQISERLLTDKTDIGIVEGECMSPDLLSISLTDDELVLICGRHHRLASVTVVPPHELQQEDFIIREPGSGTRQTFEDMMKAHALSWKAAWVCNNADTIKAAVAAGLGVSVLSARTVEKEARAGELMMKPIQGIRFMRTFKIIYHKNKYLTEQMTKFTDYARLMCEEKE
ncbi:MAG: transcriptional regulator [Clostridium sp. SCN 57-10]|nr:MAG: transcriptional regulator [Clostridium sp. SCN 57-10]